MKNIKRQCIPFSFYDITGMENHLEAMALNGWMLEKIGSFFWTYRRCEPKNIHFAVTYYPPASAFEPEPSEGQQTFTDFCDHAGWRLAGSNAQMMIFANEQENPVPIHTDPEPEIESLERMAKRTIWSWFVLLALFLFRLWLSVGDLLRDPIDLLSSPMQIISNLCTTSLALYFALELFTWFRWRKRARAAAVQGEFVPTHGHHRLFAGILVFFLLGMVYAMLAERQSGSRQLVLLLLAGYMGLFAVVNGVRTLLRKKKVSTSRNRLITLAVDLVLALVLCGGISWFCFHTAGAGNAEPAEMAVTIEALTGEPDDALVQNSSFNTSFLLSQRDFFQHPPFDQPRKDAKTLRYTQLDVHFLPLYDVFLNNLFHKYDRFYPENEASLHSYEEADPTPWGCDTAYQFYSSGEADSSYLLCWADRIVALEADWTLTDEQMAIAGAALAP